MRTGPEIHLHKDGRRGARFPYAKGYDATTGNLNVSMKYTADDGLERGARIS